MNAATIDSFCFRIPNLKKRTYDVFAILIILIHATIFTWLFFSTTSTSQKKIAAYAIVVSFLFFTIEKIAGQHKSKIAAIQTTLIFLSTPWLLLQLYLPGILVLVIAALYLIAKRELTITVTKGKIIYPSFPARNIDWDTVSNVILKDGLLTIDFKNNKLIQQLIEEINPVNQEEFNEFCRAQLRK